MAEILTNYYSRFENVSHYFIVSREYQSSNVEVVENYIYVKCPEMMMNILRKTMTSMKHLLEIGEDFDYLVRANISTLINVPKLITYLEPISRTNFYGGGQIGEIDWVTATTVNDTAGVNNYAFFGTKFFQGTSILFSKDVVKYMCDNCDKLEYTIIDDVSIGIFMRFHRPNIFTSPASNILQVTNIWIPSTYTHFKIYNGTPEGRLNRGLRATYCETIASFGADPINELKSNPPASQSEDCPVSNLHRCNARTNHRVNSYCFLVHKTFDDILEEAIFYRNKSPNRFDDVSRMRKLANIL